MEKIVINELIKKYDIVLIEKHLIYWYLENNELDLKKSLVLSKFMAGFKPSQELISLISKIKKYDLKQLEKYLELLIPRQDRKVNGAFFTPTYVVEFIIKSISPQANEKCLDPSCGSGAFLVGLVEYFRKKYNKSVKEIIQKNIYGSDILEYNVRRAKIILSIYGLINNEIIEETDFNIFFQDSLQVKWSVKFDVIVGNPPYVKYQDLTDANRHELIKKWDTINNGTFNMYFAFFELGYNLLNKGGRLGYITPNNYFTSLSALPLRQFFQRKKCISRIIDFTHKKVFEAQTYTAITFIDTNSNSTILYDKIKDSQDCEEFLISANGSANILNDLTEKKWRLYVSEEQENIAKIENIGTPIKSLFKIAVGIATLKDEVFLVDSKNEKDGYIIKTTENGDFEIEKEITKPVYKISKFKNQDEISNNTLRIITPYVTNTKVPKPIPENEFQKKYPKCYKYLLSEKIKLKNREKGKGDFSPFYVWGRTQGIARFGKKILNPTFSKHPRFLYVPQEDAYFINGYGIYIESNNNEMTTLFDTQQNPIIQEKNVLLLQKILNSIVMDYYIRKTSISIQGGFHCYQKNFIEKFTIPNFTEEEITEIDNLSDSDEIDSFLIKKYQLKDPIPNRFS